MQDENPVPLIRDGFFCHLPMEDSHNEKGGRMGKRIIVILLLCISVVLFPGMVVAVEWKIFSRNKHLTQFYFDKDSVNNISGNIIRVYIKTVPSAEQKIDKIRGIGFKGYQYNIEREKAFEKNKLHLAESFLRMIDDIAKTDHEISLSEFNCSERKERLISKDTYDKRKDLLTSTSAEAIRKEYADLNAGQEFINEFIDNVGLLRWDDIKPETIFEDLFNILCKKKKR
jgi:hypothetical protein